MSCLQGLVWLIVLDNGSQFTAKEFHKFCKLFNVEYVKIAPYHARSNGMTERFVDMFKRTLKKG